MINKRDILVTSFGNCAHEYFADVLAEPNTLPALFINPILNGGGEVFGYAPDDLVRSSDLNFHWSLASNRKSQKLTGFNGGRARIVSVFSHLLNSASKRSLLCSDITLMTNRAMQHGGPDPSGQSFLAYEDECYILISGLKIEKRVVTHAIAVTGQLWHSMFLIVDSTSSITNRHGIILASRSELEELVNHVVVLAVQAWDGEEFLYWVPHTHSDEVLEALRMFISVPEIGA